MSCLTHCRSCHLLHIAAEQRLSRADWEETLLAMRATKACRRYRTQAGSTILDYLSQSSDRSSPRNG